MTTETRKRQNYTEDFKRDAVSLVTEQGYKISEAARSLDIGANLLGRWRRQFEEEASGSRLGVDEREELKQLRKENRMLRMEKEILKNPRRHNGPARRNRNSRDFVILVAFRRERPSAFWWTTPLKNMVQGL